MCTGWSPALSRHLVAAYRVPDTLGSAFQMRTGQSPNLPAVSRRHPTWSRNLRNRQLKPGLYPFGPTQGPESACLSRITLVRLCSEGFGDDWPIIRHPVSPTRQTKIHLGFSGFVVNRPNLSLHYIIPLFGLLPAHLLAVTFMSTPTYFQIESPGKFPIYTD